MGHVLTRNTLIYRDTAVSVTVPCSFGLAVAVQVN